MGGFSVNDDGISLCGDLLRSVPYLFHEGAGGIIFLDGYAQVPEFSLHGYGGPESGDEDDVIRGDLLERDQGLARGVIQEAYAKCFEVPVDEWVMDHFAQQEYPLSGILLNGPERDLYGILHAVAEPEMPGQIELYRTGIDEGG